MSMLDIISDAYTLTGRYDLQKSQLAVLVKQVARQVSLSGKWGEDYVEVVKEFPTASTMQTISKDELGLVVYESVLAIPPGGSPIPLEQMLPRHILGSVGTCLASNSYYTSNTGLELNCTHPFASAYIGGYFADVGNEDYWMYSTIPEIITAGLSAQIYRLLGEVESFSMYETEFQRLLAIFKANRADLGTRAPAQITIRSGEQSSGGVTPGPAPDPDPDPDPVPVPDGAHLLTAGDWEGYIGFFAPEGVGTLTPDTIEVMGDDYYVYALYVFEGSPGIFMVSLELADLPNNVEIYGGTLTVGGTVLSEFSGVEFWENLTAIFWQAPGALWVEGQEVFVTVELDARESRPEPTFDPTHSIVPEEFEYQGWTVLGFSSPGDAGSLTPDEVSIPQEVYNEGHPGPAFLNLYIDEVLFDPNGGILLSIADWPDYFNLVESRLWVRDQELVSSGTTPIGNTLILSWPTQETPWVAGLEEPIRLELEVEDLRWGILSQSFTVGVGSINSKDHGYNTNTGSLTPTDQITIRGGECPIVRLSLAEDFGGRTLHLHVGTDDDFSWGPHGRNGWSVEVDGVTYPATGHSWGNPATMRFLALDAARWLAGTEKEVTFHQTIFTPTPPPPVGPS